MDAQQRKSTNTTFAFGSIFLLLALSLLAVSFSTNNWLETYVSRDSIRANGVSEASMDLQDFYNRYRGLFFTCFPDDATFLDNVDIKDHVKDGRCLAEQGYEVPTRNEETVSYSDGYQIRIHLMRSHFGAMVLSMFFLLICIVTGVMSCWNKNTSLMKTTGILTFVGMFFAGAGMALFHGYHYLEINVLREVPHTPAWIDKQAQSNLVYAYLNRNSSTQFGFSYILGWLGLAMAAIAAILFLITSYKLSAAEDATYPRKRRGLRNRAYDHMDQPQPTLVYPSDEYYKSQPRSQASTYPTPEVGYFESSPYDFGGKYRY